MFFSDYVVFYDLNIVCHWSRHHLIFQWRQIILLNTNKQLDVTYFTEHLLYLTTVHPVLHPRGRENVHECAFLYECIFPIYFVICWCHTEGFYSEITTARVQTHQGEKGDNDVNRESATLSIIKHLTEMNHNNDPF